MVRFLALVFQRCLTPNILRQSRCRSVRSDHKTLLLEIPALLTQDVLNTLHLRRLHRIYCGRLVQFV